MDHHIRGGKQTVNFPLHHVGDGLGVFEGNVAGERQAQIHEQSAAALARPDAVETEHAGDPRHGICDQGADSGGCGVHQRVDGSFPQAQRDVNHNPRHRQRRCRVGGLQPAQVLLFGNVHRNQA